MASGDSLLSFKMNQGVPPTSNAARPDRRNAHPLYNFGPAVDEELHFMDWLPNHYGGGGIDCKIKWLAATATSGNVVHELSFERILAGTTDLDTDSFATAKKTGGVATSGTSGVTTETTIAFTNSEIDGLLKNEFFRLKYRRLGSSDASDTMSGDGQLQSIYFTET